MVTVDGLETTIDSPTMPLYGIAGLSSDGWTDKDIILDLAGQPLDKDRASIAVTMTWDIPVEDYDLDVFDAFGGESSHSENIQPVNGPEETGSVTAEHCDVFTARALSWVAAGQSTLTLSFATFLL